jgi:hypothetical protein
MWAALRDEHGLSGWQAAHLWGPGFGDEAAAGMFLAPEEVNQIWQNQSVEDFLRSAFKSAAEWAASGGAKVDVRLRAMAVSHPRTVAGGSVLGHVEYEFFLAPHGETPTPFGRIGFSVDPPPHGKVSEPYVKVFL